jgi:16S rRNA (uracil1498-N3)-methyltransferase
VTATLLVTRAELDAAEIAVEGDAFHHVFRAARARVGEAVRVVDGEGRAREGLVTGIERRRGSVRLLGEAPSREPRLRLELLVAAPRPSRASWLVEKGTELGVSSFRFVDTERSERPLDESDAERLRRVARAAVEQCGRSRLPEIVRSRPLAETLAHVATARTFALDPGAMAGPAGLDAGAAPRAAVLIGPEGGLTRAELDAALGAGATAVRLGRAVLRVETAALAAAAWLLLGSAD